MNRVTLSLSLVLACAAVGCGPGVDRQDTLSRLRDAITEELPPGDTDTLGEHNQLVLTVRDGNVLDGMRRHEVEEAIGRGQECADRALCAENGFNPTDWTYEIGRRDGMAWGPTLIVGFDRQGFVDGIYTLTRN